MCLCDTLWPALIAVHAKPWNGIVAARFRSGKVSSMSVWIKGDKLPLLEIKR